MSLNTITLSGNLGADPEMRFTTNDIAITNFSIAVKVYKNGKNDTFWIDCKAFKNTAEFAEKHLCKGDTVAITGKLDIEAWEKDGVRHRKAVVIVNEIQLMKKDKPVTVDPQSAESDLLYSILKRTSEL
jgi:single-strand DNA-binding protein